MSKIFRVTITDPATQRSRKVTVCDLHYMFEALAVAREVVAEEFDVPEGQLITVECKEEKVDGEN